MLQCGSFSWLCEVPPMLTLAKKPFLTSVGNPCRKQPTETIIQVLTSLLLLPNIKSTQPLFLHEKEKWSGMRGTNLQTFSAFWNESEVRRRVGPRFKSLLTAWFPVVQQRWREMSPPPSPSSTFSLLLNHHKRQAIQKHPPQWESSLQFSKCPTCIFCSTGAGCRQAALSLSPVVL